LSKRHTTRFVTGMAATSTAAAVPTVSGNARIQLFVNNTSEHPNHLHPRTPTRTPAEEAPEAVETLAKARPERMRSLSCTDSAPSSTSLSPREHDSAATFASPHRSLPSKARTRTSADVTGAQRSERGSQEDRRHYGALDLRDTDDMIHMTRMNVHTILHNLQERYLRDTIYVCTLWMQFHTQSRECICVRVSGCMSICV
jgi:hypothetical protein